MNRTTRRPTVDGLALLTAHRPSQHHLDAAWPAERTERMLAAVRTAVDTTVHDTSVHDATVHATTVCAAVDAVVVDAEAVPIARPVPDPLGAGGRQPGPTGSDRAAGSLVPPFGRRPARRRVGGRVPRVAAIAIAACLLAVAPSVIMPMIAPRQAPRAEALTQLARTAAALPAVTIPPGRYQHLVIRSQQQGTTTADGTGMPTTSVVNESWTDARGTIWRRDVEQGRVSFYRFPPSDPALFPPTTPAGMAALPTDPGALSDVLRARVGGSNSTDEAVFVAVGDMLRFGYAPPALRSAALTVISRLPEVTSTATTVHGAPAVKVSFVDEANRPGAVQSLIFARDTAALLAEEQLGRIQGVQVSYVSNVVEDGVVDAVPREVLARAVLQS